MKKSVLISLSFLLATFGLQAKEATLSMVYTNALHEELPFAIYSKNSWSPEPQARFVKLHLYFDEPIFIKGAEIDTCGAKIDPNISIFFNFDQFILSPDKEMQGEIPSALYPKAKNGKLALAPFLKRIEVRSLTINFERNRNFKICDISLMDEKYKPYKIKVPEIVQGTVSADSVLAPASAYAPIYLFDSRFEYAWASDKKAKDVNLKFNFKKKQKITKLRIWNGYQRSVNHCYSNSRAKNLKITGDGGYSAVVTVKDVLGSQIVDLPRPFIGKNLQINIVDSYRGKKYKDLVISELRFYNGDEWFLIDPLSSLQSNIAANKKNFASNNIEFLLNESFHGWDDHGSFSGRLRLRADGSFYFSGAMDQSFEFFALGNYEIKESSSKGVLLRLFGLFYETEVYGDCNGCGRDCNTSNSDSEFKIFHEYMLIKKNGDNSVLVTNRKGGRRIKFDKVILKKDE